MLTELSEKIPKYYCDCCDTKTNNKKDYEKHILTAKHKNKTFVNKTLTSVNKTLTEISPNNMACDYMCKNCNKEYKSRVGLWKHKKICGMNDSKAKDFEVVELNEQQNETVDLIKYLIKENSDFKQMIIEQNKQMIEMSKNNSITNNNNNINSHNKTFNLQFFLNETCKDAMNIMDFVDSIKLQLCDLESVGKLGYIEGISNIIVKNLNLLDETKRPVHCADSKREVMYVKDDNKWEKENADKSKLRNAIKCVSRKNSKLLKDFRSQHPDCDKSDSKYSTKYDKLTLEAFGGKGDDYEGKENKIIKNIAKNVVIDKYND